MIDAADFLKWCEIFNVTFGGNPPSDVSLQNAYNNSDGSILETPAKPFVLKDIVASGSASSLFDIFSTTKGSRPFPSMTTVQRNAISAPATGLTIYNTDTNDVNYYNSSAWVSVNGNATLQQAYDNGDGSILEIDNKPFVLKDITATGDKTSLFDAFSITKGSRPFPQMTTIQRDAIVTPVNGLIIFNTDTNLINYYNVSTSSWDIIDTSTGLTLQNVYDNGNGTITIENSDNTKPFAVGKDETNLFPGYGVYVSATRNLQASPSNPWFHFMEAYDNSSSIAQFGAWACEVLDGTPGAVAGRMLFGAAIPGDGEVVPFYGANGLSSHCENYYDLDSINRTAISNQNIINHNFVANNSSSVLKTYVCLNPYLSDNTAGAEDGLLNLQVMQSGTLTTYIQLLGGVGTIGINKPSIYSGFLNINSQNLTNVGNITTASSPDPSAQLQLTSISKAFLPNAMSSAQFAGISSPATGLLAYDTDKLRYTSWNGSAIKDIAYTTDITGQSGTYVPVFSGASGGTTFALIKALYSTNSTASGSVVNVTMQFTYTATLGSAAISISLPINTTFSSTGQAAVSGGEVYASVPAIGDGMLINVDTIATQNTVTATWIVATSSGTKTVNLSFSYQIQ